MSSDASLRAPVAPGCATAARIAAAGAAAVIVIILALHVIKPELEPSWRFLSEYAIGRRGWLMQAAFCIWAASCAALASALRGEVRALPGRIGIVVLYIVSYALIAAGLFPQDAVTIKPDEGTTSGMVHAVASLIGIPGTPLAAMLISSSLWRNNPAWMPYRAVLMTAAHATWISLVLMIAYLAWAVPKAGGFNPAVSAGWMNRLVVATYLAWLLVVAYRLLERSKVSRQD
jgi:hypothetical protein